MFDRVDNQLEEWIKKVQDKVEVTFTPPDTSLSQTCIFLYLLDVVPNLTGRSQTPTPLQIMLRYLVAPVALDPRASHRILGELLVAALENKEFEIEKEPLPMAAWTAFAMMPRPSFILRVPFRLERAVKLAPPVRHPLVLQPAPFQTLSGEVLGPEDAPIMNARVEIPLINRATLTDYQGRFQFSAVPSEPKIKKLLVRAKGRVFSVETDQNHSLDEKLTINLKLEE